MRVLHKPVGLLQVADLGQQFGSAEGIAGQLLRFDRRFQG